MTNKEIAALFIELADIMELAGENYFKVKAYRNAALVIEGRDNALSNMSAAEISDISGIGSAITEKIRASIDTGTFPTLERWRQSSFSTFRPLLCLPGVTLRKLRTIIRKLNLQSLDDLKTVVDNDTSEAYKSLDKESENFIRELKAKRW